MFDKADVILTTNNVCKLWSRLAQCRVLHRGRGSIWILYLGKCTSTAMENDFITCKGLRYHLDILKWESVSNCKCFSGKVILTLLLEREGSIAEIVQIFLQNRKKTSIWWERSAVHHRAGDPNYKYGNRKNWISNQHHSSSPLTRGGIHITPSS